MKIYLAGPMTDCTEEVAREWRDYAVSSLAYGGFTFLSPLRGSKAVGERAEFYRDCWDIRQSEIVLVNCSDTTEKSTGTLMEMMYAWSNGKYVVAVLDQRHDHLFTREATSYRAHDLDDALSHIRVSFAGK